MFVTKSLKALELSRNPEFFFVKGLWSNCNFSFIHSYLDYANITWVSTDNQIHQKQKYLQTFLHTWNLSLKMQLTLYEINLFHVLPLIIKCKNRIAPFVFHNLYTLKPLSKYSLRTDNLLSMPLKWTKFGQFSISFRGRYLWNKIFTKKTHICSLEYYPLFRNRLKEVIFSLNDTTM